MFPEGYKLKKTIIYKETGLTSVEMVVYAAMLVVIFVAISTVFVGIIKKETLSLQKVKYFDEADFAMRQVVDKGRLSKGIDASSIFNNADNKDTLILNIDGGSTVTFSVNANSQMEMFDSLLGSQVLTSDQVSVEKFDLTAIPDTGNPKGVQVVLTVKNKQSNDAYSIQTSIIPRSN